MRIIAPGTICLLLLSNSLQAETNQKSDTIDKYLVDFNGGPLAAGDIVGLNKSSITNIQSQSDLLLAINPLKSQDSSSTGYGIAITPSRTSLFPMIGKNYDDDSIYRFLASTTISYAVVSS